MSHNFGTTNNFSVDTTDSFWSGLTKAQQTNITSNANYLLGQMETAFATTTGWFGTDTSKFGPSIRQEVLLLDLDRTGKKDGYGANNSGYGNPINVDAQKDNSTNTAGPEGILVKYGSAPAINSNSVLAVDPVTVAPPDVSQTVSP